METLVGASPTSIAATVHSPPYSSNKRRNVLVRVKPSGENDTLFEAAIHRASLRFQENHRPGISIPVKSAKMLILNITLHLHLVVKTMCANSLLRVEFALVCVISQV